MVQNRATETRMVSNVILGLRRVNSSLLSQLEEVELSPESLAREKVNTSEL